MPRLPRSLSILLALLLALTTLTTGAAASPPRVTPDTEPVTLKTVPARGAQPLVGNYPITIAPLFYAEQKIIAPDGETYDNFGYAVALSGDTALVGAYEDDAQQGTAYVFVRDGTMWTLQQRLTPDGLAAGQFGSSVALSGDTALVGAEADESGGNSHQGSAYVFTRSGTTWTLEQKLTASDGSAFDYFGDSVALSGDTALVGAYGDNSSRGSAYIFMRSGTTWMEQAKLNAWDAAAGDLFGTAVALSSDTALIGAWRDSTETHTDAGSAYVFTGSGAFWAFQQKLTASDAAANDGLGYSVALSGDTALVGTPWDDGKQGSAYVFVREGTLWSEQAKLTASDGAADDEFGDSVALSGDTALVGADGHKIGYYARQGSAYVFTRNGTTWTQAATLIASDGDLYDEFGWSVAVSGGTALVGAHWNTVGTNSQQGAAYFYDPMPDGVYLPAVLAP